MDSVRAAGGSLDPRDGAWRSRPGWIGRIFEERYHAHVLATPTEMAHALEYIRDNALKHYRQISEVRVSLASGRVVKVDAFTSFALPLPAKAINSGTFGNSAPQREPSIATTSTKAARRTLKPKPCTVSPHGFLMSRALSRLH